jgi:hypothetical protein
VHASTRHREDLCEVAKHEEAFSISSDNLASRNNIIIPALQNAGLLLFHHILKISLRNFLDTCTTRHGTQERNLDFNHLFAFVLRLTHCSLIDLANT